MRSLTVIHLKKSRIYWYVLTSIFLLAMHACEKGIDTTGIFGGDNESVRDYRNLYNQLKVGDRLSDTLSPGVIVNYLPQWDEAREYQKNDSSHHAIVPLTLIVDNKGEPIVATTVSDFPFLFVLNGKDFYFGRFFTKSANGHTGVNALHKLFKYEKDSNYNFINYCSIKHIRTAGYFKKYQ